jgi:hypothetical protein
MQRNTSAILGMMVVFATFVFVVIGCTSSNPVNPVIDNSGGQNSPGTDAILNDDQIDIDDFDDVIVGGNMEKEQPGIVEFIPGEEPEVEIPERVDAAEFLEQDITR